MNLHLQLALNPCATIEGAAPVALGGRDAALLAWLALEGPTPRARLAQLLWPGSESGAARNALRQRLFQLRRSLGSDVVAGSEVLALAPSVEHDLADADTLLADLPDEIGGEFAQWLAQQRERRQGRMRHALVELAERAEAARDYGDALTHAQELLALEPLSEDAHRRVMRLHYLAGDRAAALLAFDRCEQVLKDEVGARPGSDTLALLATIEAAAPEGPITTRVMPASVLRPPRLIGRDRELAAIDAAWQSGQVVAVVGEAGIGKSRLLQSLLDRQGGIVKASGRPGDAGVPFATLARLLRAVHALPHGGMPAEGYPLMQGDIARVLPEAVPESGQAAGPGQRLAIARAVRGFLQGRGELRGLVVDDLHFADEASLDMLQALIDPGEADPASESARLRWALAYRPAEAGSPVQALQDALAELVQWAPVHLQPLGLHALAQLVDSLELPGIDGTALAPSLLQRTGGNPLFVLETLKQAWVDETLTSLPDEQALPRPTSVGRLIERRIAQLSPGALALARVASIAGVDFSIELAAHVQHMPALHFADELNELEAAHVLRGDAFAHDLVYDAVRASLPESLARHLHGQVAGWLELHGGQPARIAQHWMSAAKGRKALPWLKQAADHATQAVRYKEALEFLEAKSRIEEQEGLVDEAFDTHFEAADLQLRADLSAQNEHSSCRAMERLARSPRQELLALLARGDVHAHRGEFTQAESAARAALTRCTSVDQPDLTARTRQLLGESLLMLGRSAEASSHLEACLAWYEQFGDDGDARVCHNDLAMLYDDMGRPEDALPHHQRNLEISLRNSDLLDAATACSNLAANRIDAGDLQAAELSLRQSLIYQSETDSSGGSIGIFHGQRVLCLCGLARYTEALSEVELSVAAIRRFQPGFLAQARMREALCWWHLGQTARQGQVLDSIVIDAASSPPVRATHARLSWQLTLGKAQTVAMRAASRERLAEALAAIDPGSRVDLTLPLRMDLALFEEPLQGLQALADVAQECERIGHLGTAVAAHARLAGMAAEIDAERARQAALRALELHARGRRPITVLPGEVWLHAGRAFLAAGDQEAAIRTLARGREWLMVTADQQVPGEFRAGFLQRNPVNRELLALVARVGVNATDAPRSNTSNELSRDGLTRP